MHQNAELIIDRDRVKKKHETRKGKTLQLVANIESTFPGRSRNSRLNFFLRSKTDGKYFAFSANSRGGFPAKAHTLGCRNENENAFYHAADISFATNYDVSPRVELTINAHTE